MEIKERIAQEIEKYGFNISLAQLLQKVYWQLVAEDYDIYILNERYLTTGHGGQDFQLLKTRSKGKWTVREF